MPFSKIKEIKLILLTNKLCLSLPKNLSMTNIAILCFVVIIIVAHLFTPEEYHWKTNTISDLAAQNYNKAWIMRAGFIAFGLLMNIGLFIKFYQTKIINYGDILIMIYATSVLLTGFFSTAPFDGTQNYSVTSDKLHSMFAQVAGFALSLGILAYLIKSPSQEKTFHLIFLILIIGLSGLFGLSKNDVISQSNGIIQRVLYFVGFTWMWTVYK